MINFESEVFCNRVKNLFGDIGQMELAEKIGISQGVISSIKNNKAKAPAADTIFRIARYFNVSADYLLGLSDVASVDVDLQAVCNYTGISEKSVQLLHELKKYNIHDAAEILLGNINNVSFFAEFSDMNWEIQQIVRIKERKAEIREENGEIIEKIRNEELPLSELSEEEREAYDEFYALTGEKLFHERERDQSLFGLCKRIQEIAAELEREGTASNENT